MLPERGHVWDGPFTENMPGLDSFPRGGQDFELSMLFTIVMFCMALVAVFLGLKLAKRLFEITSCEPHEFWIFPMSFFRCFLVGTAVWVGGFRLQVQHFQNRR